MSGFFKGIFGGRSEEEEEALAAAAAQPSRVSEEEALDEFHADVRGTIDTRVDPDVLADAREKQAVETPNAATQTKQPVVNPIDSVEFNAETVWNEAGVSSLEQRTVAKAQQLLWSLPAETPNLVKRQIVEAALKAFEVSIDEIVAGANHQLQSLQDYISTVNEDAQTFTADSEARIAELEAEIEHIRNTIRDAEDDRSRLVGAATDVITEVQPVLEFFSPDGAAVTASASTPVDPVTTNDSDELDASQSDALE